MLTLRIAALAVAGFCTLAGIILYANQRRLIYYPNPARVSPQAAGLDGVEERILATPDGNRLVAWWSPPRSGRPTLLYFHGNAGNLAIRAERFAAFREHGLGFYAMSYRGYGGSTGEPTEAHNIADANLAYDAVRRLGVEPRDLVIYGESLGTGVATPLAADRPSAALVLESPYTSITAMGELRYPWLPVRQLLIDRYDTIDTIGRVHVPVLVMHGEDDHVVPVAMGRAVYAAANEPKKLVIFPHGGHSNLFRYGEMGVLDRFLRGLRGDTDEGRLRPAAAN